MIAPAAAEPRVLLIGEGPTALSALRSLAGCCRVLAVLRTVADPAADPVHAEACSLGIPVHPLADRRDLPGIIADLRPEAVVISSYDRILPPEVLALGLFINVHYAPLPRYRGRANVNWAIINGEETAAISIHLVAPGLDDGPLLFQESVAIGPADTASSVYEALNAVQQRALGPTVLRALAGDCGRPQDAAEATYGCARLPTDGEIDWSASTAAVDRLVRALAPPFPGAYTHLEGRPVTVLRAAPVAAPRRYAGRIPGRVVGRSGRQGWVDVLTGDGVLRLLEVAADAGPPAPAADVIHSTRQTLGLSRVDLLRRVECLERRLAELAQAVGKA